MKEWQREVTPRSSVGALSFKSICFRIRGRDFTLQREVTPRSSVGALSFKSICFRIRGRDFTLEPSGGTSTL